jgi:hypothetical protein
MLRYENVSAPAKERRMARAANTDAHAFSVAFSRGLLARAERSSHCGRVLQL